MQPTTRAMEMGAQVHAALAQLQAALARPDFTPALSERRFVLVAGSYSSAVLAPALVRRFAEAAPLAELAISPYTADTFDRMDAHRVDFLVGSEISGPARFGRDVLLTDDVVWVVRAGHPLSELAQVDLAALVAFPQVLITSPLLGAEQESDRRAHGQPLGSNHYSAYEAALAAKGLTRRVGIIVPDIYAAMSVAAGSDMAVLVPRRLAAASVTGGRFRMIEAPYESPTAELSILYLKDRLVEPAIAWMRDLIRRTATSL
jgi:DNA-binding transcriptional LysR family regulator